MFKKKIVCISVIGILISTLMLTACSSNSSQTAKEPTYPEKPIQLIMAYKAGGGTDRMFRGFQKYLEAELGQPINAVYKPGAEGVIGWTAIANAKPDGYTVGIINMPNATASIVSGDAPFDVDSFEYLGNITYEPPILAVAKNNSKGIKTLDDFIKYAKEHPGEVTVGNSGTGGDEYIASRILQQSAGIKLKDVPFDATSAAAAALLGGHIDAQMTSAFAIINLIQSGEVIVLGVGSEERSEEFPEIPTFIEQGVDLKLGGIRGIVAPLEFPEEAKKVWVKAIKNMLENEEYREKAKESKTTLMYMDPEKFKEFAQGLYDQYKKLWDEEPW